MSPTARPDNSSAAACPAATLYKGTELPRRDLEQCRYWNGEWGRRHDAGDHIATNKPYTANTPAEPPAVIRPRDAAAVQPLRTARRLR